VAEQVGDRPAAKARRVPGQSLTWIRLCVGEAPPSMAKPSVDGVGTGGWGAGPDQAARHLRRHVDRTGAGSAPSSVARPSVRPPRRQASSHRRTGSKPRRDPRDRHAAAGGPRSRCLAARRPAGRRGDCSRPGRVTSARPGWRGGAARAHTEPGPLRDRPARPRVPPPRQSRPRSTGRRPVRGTAASGARRRQPGSPGATPTTPQRGSRSRLVDLPKRRGPDSSRNVLPHTLLIRR
jgi:hypothetical protein